MKRKGFWRTLESVMAVTILVFFMLAVGAKHMLPPPETGLPRIGYEILKDLDNKGELRSLVLNNQTDDLNSQIHIQGYSHTIQICDFQGVCSGNEPDARNVWVSAYIISGGNTYDPHEVRLFIW